MNNEKAQVATEYIIITGFILAVVTIIFAYAYISNNENIKVNQASTALDKMVNAANLVYALGPGNIQYIEVTFPQGITEIQDVTVCNSGIQNYNQDCTEEDGVNFGAIEMTAELLSGETSIMRGAKTELELDGEIPEDERIPENAGVYRIKIEWCDDKICLKSA